MKCIIDNQIVLSRTLEGPIATYIRGFARSLRKQGYSRRSIHRQALLAACFSQWLEQKAVALGAITSDLPAQFFQHRARKVLPNPGDAAALTHLLEFLRREGVVPAGRIPAQRLTPAERWTRAFEEYLLEARGLARATIQNYAPFIRSFLKDRFDDGPVTLSRLSARDVVRFVQHRTRHMHRKRAKILTSALRSFLQYARYRGKLKLDLAGAVPTVANWSMTSLPRAIPADQTRRLLASVDRRTATGRRDYAVLLLLARLGLRSSEVALLELDDIDWNAGQFSVRGKAGQRSQQALPRDVGEAIAGYLRHGRPDSTSRRVFIRAKAPLCGFKGPSAVGSIVRHSLQRAGIHAPTEGTHQFRHGLATEMLRRGASLTEIGDLLGHRSPETTKIYTKVDLDALRTLALPWPGGAR